MWPTTSSIETGELLPFQMVSYFHWSWSNTTSIAPSELLLLLPLVGYFFHYSWSTSSSIAADQLLHSLQLVKYVFHCIWSNTSSIAAGQLVLP
jgi:hypothetical protein